MQRCESCVFMYLQYLKIPMILNQYQDIAINIPAYPFTVLTFQENLKSGFYSDIRKHSW